MCWCPIRFLKGHSAYPILLLIFKRRVDFSMLKLVHLLVGAIALIATFIFEDKDKSFTLAYFALANLLIAPILPVWARGARRQMQSIVSLLIILATIVQGFFLLNGTTDIDGTPASYFSLTLLASGVVLHLVLNLRKVAPKSVPLSQDLTNRETGTVKWFNTSKGFGFISRDTGDDIFVHFRAIRGEGHRVLVEGQRVEFTVMQRDKGLQAEDVIAALPN